MGLGVEPNRTASAELYDECSVEFPDGLPCALEGGAMQTWYMARSVLGVLGMDSAIGWFEGALFGAGDGVP